MEPKYIAIRYGTPDSCPFVNDWMHIRKKQRVNPDGDNIYLRKDDSLLSEIDLIKHIQRNFLERYHAPDGKGYQKTIDSFQNTVKKVEEDKIRNG
jgi:hypothetical protein